MPSFLASGGPHDPEALALIAALVAAARDRFPYSRADGICGRSSYSTSAEGAAEVSQGQALGAQPWFTTNKRLRPEMA